MVDNFFILDLRKEINDRIFSFFYTLLNIPETVDVAREEEVDC